MAILKFKRINLAAIKVPFFKDKDIEKVLLSNNISFGEKKPIITLLVTSIMMIKLSYYI